jgi:hypothetical protein
MNAGNRIEITDKEGWRKEFTLDKRLIYVGNDARNDIVLSPVRGSGVSPRHLQLIAAPHANGMFNAVNLSPVSIPLGESGGRVLEPNSAMEVADGESFHLGEFTLKFHLQESIHPGSPAEPAQGEAAVPLPTGSRSSSIGLRISLPQPVVNPEGPLEGIIYVANLGGAPGVQFKVWIDGLPAESCEIGPAPILFPGAEKGIPFRLYHPCLSNYPAGTHQLSFRAVAADAYPGESATLSREIRFLPFYRHSLRLVSVD